MSLQVDAYEAQKQELITENTDLRNMLRSMQACILRNLSSPMKLIKWFIQKFFLCIMMHEFLIFPYVLNASCHAYDLTSSNHHFLGSTGRHAWLFECAREFAKIFRRNQGKWHVWSWATSNSIRRMHGKLWFFQIWRCQSRLQDNVDGTSVWIVVSGQVYEICFWHTHTDSGAGCYWFTSPNGQGSDWAKSAGKNGFNQGVTFLPTTQNVVFHFWRIHSLHNFSQVLMLFRFNRDMFHFWQIHSLHNFSQVLMLFRFNRDKSVYRIISVFFTGVYVAVARI